MNKAKMFFGGMFCLVVIIFWVNWFLWYNSYQLSASMIDNMDYITVYIDNNESEPFVFKLCPKDISYENEWVLWKGAYKGELVLKNGERYDLFYSIYDNFFAIDGHDGYYRIHKQNQIYDNYIKEK